MDTLGAALVIAGVVIAGCSLASLAVLALAAVAPWSRFRPRYQRGVDPAVRTASLAAVARRSALGARDGARRHIVRRRAASRHPRGGRHLLPLGR